MAETKNFLIKYPVDPNSLWCEISSPLTMENNNSADGFTLDKLVQEHGIFVFVHISSFCADVQCSMNIHGVRCQKHFKVHVDDDSPVKGFCHHHRAEAQLQIMTGISNEFLIAKERIRKRKAMEVSVSTKQRRLDSVEQEVPGARVASCECL